MSFALLSAIGCNKDDDEVTPVEETPTTLVGQDGNPRFNLVFTNPENVDLDLYVKAPNGTIVYYGNPSGAGGTLDVDCLCGDCPQGPNENIFGNQGKLLQVNTNIGLIILVVVEVQTQVLRLL